MYGTLRCLFSAFAALAMVFTAGITTGQTSQTSLDSMLKPYLSQYNLPAIAAAVVKDGNILSAGAVGTRRVGTNIAVTIDDRFHIGSDTKAMTALLAAMMVEEGKLRWNSTVAEIFPELAPTMDRRLRLVTLTQLLSHTSGIPTDNKETIRAYLDAMSQDGNLSDLRYWLVRRWSKQPLASAPGKQFAYANMGYAIAGAMMERVARKTWDELITERIFVPLNLKTAGLGPQASLGRIDAPVGHEVIEGKMKAFLGGPNADGPIVLGPAGIAHMSILDFAQWAGWNAGEGKRGPALVTPETVRRLHTPVISIPAIKDAPPGTPRGGGKYGYGWGQVTVDWAPHPLHHHTGSNGMNLAHIWLDTRQDFAIVIVTNVGGARANEGLFALADPLYTSFIKK